jgi:hypothetical protein
MPYRIRIFADFCDGAESKNIIETISLFCKNTDLYGANKHVFITDGDDYSHVIIWNTVMPNIRNGVPKENVIGFAYEPLVYLGLTHKFVEYAKQYIHKYYIGDLIGLPAPFVEGNGYLIYNAPLPVLRPKTRRMSLMISQKAHQPGHRYRHELAHAILKTDLPIDIYGRGCIFDIYKQGDSRIKGTFEKYELYEDYEFHICIENVQSNHYFSEKIINSLLTNTTPVYLGCKNIDKYFPDKVVHLTGSVENDMKILTDICANPAKYKKTIDVVEIEKKVSLLHNLDRVYGL